MSIDSARKGLERLATERKMLCIEYGEGRDLELSVVWDEIRCYFPDPAKVPEGDREEARDSFRDSVLALHIRPPVQTAAEAGQDITSYPDSVHVLGTGDNQQYFKSIEVVCACDQETAEAAKAAWIQAKSKISAAA